MMIRTTRYGLLGFLTAGLLAVGGAAADDKKDDKKPPPKPVGGEQVTPLLSCAQTCDDCARACDECGAHCAKMVADGKKEHVLTMKTCQDCAILCSATSRILSRDGPFFDTAGLACAQACKRCGDECEKYPSDPVMKRCAAECRRCEKACLSMLKNAGLDPNARPGK